MLWYHDHAMGINRLNICAGMLGLYIVRDSFEDGLNLPRGEFEIPLVLTDRMIRADGQLYYPVSQFANAPWLPEFIGDAVLVNGHDGRGRLHLALSISADDLEAWRKRLSDGGVDVVGEYRWPRGGVSLYMRDPDGALVELATPGLWW